MNGFVVLVNDVLKTHCLGIDDLCACGDHDGNIHWSKDATEMLIDASSSDGRCGGACNVLSVQEFTKSARLAVAGSTI